MDNPLPDTSQSRAMKHLLAELEACVSVEQLEAFDTERLQDALRDLAEVVGVTNAIFQLRNLDDYKPIMSVTGFPHPIFTERYRQSFSEVSPLKKFGIAVPVGGVLSTQSPLVRTEFERSDALQEIFRPWGIGAIYSANVNQVRTIRASLTFHVASRERSLKPLQEMVLHLVADHLKPGVTSLLRSLSPTLFTREPHNATSFANDEHKNGYLYSRHHDFINLLIENISEQAMAERLGISINGVKYYRKKVYAQVGCRNRAEFLKIILIKS